MKKSLIKFSILLLFIQIGSACFSQLIFPNGREKKMTSTLDILYEETKIPFLYPGGRIIDLGWRRYYDTIPTDWFVMACMNGTCLGGVPETGQFDNFMGSPDSIGFLKYHLDFKNVPGTAIIKFILYKELAWGGSLDTVTFNITHITNNGINTANNFSDFSVYPNPSSIVWHVKGQSASPVISAQLTDILGENLKTLYPSIINNYFFIDISNQFLSPGIYFLRLQTENFSRTIQLIKK